MSTETRQSMEKARESVEKAAYAAVGAPIAAVKALSARVSDLREAVRSSSKDMSDDLTREMDEWIAEGEKVIGRAMDRLKASGVVEEVRSRAVSAKGAAETGIEKATGSLEKRLDVFAPDQELTVINGIGPGYADQLRDAGVAGVTGFIQRTETPELVTELAEDTGISATNLETWRRQVDLTRVNGIGSSYEMLLHRAGVWTLPQLAKADGARLAADLNAVDMPDAPEHMPSPETIEEWSREAKTLT